MLDDLRDALARLYGDEASARRVAEEAGLPSVFIDYDGSAIDVWHRIVRQAAARHKLTELVAVAAKDYPTSPVWIELVKRGLRLGNAPEGSSSVGSDEDKVLEQRVWEVRVELSGLKVSLVWLSGLVGLLAVGEVAMLIKMFGG